LLDQRGHLISVLATARSDHSATKRSIKKLERKLKLLEQDIAPLESREKQDYAKRRNSHFHPYWEAKDAHERSIRQQREAARKRPQVRARRKQFVQRVRRDIERAFMLGAAMPAARRVSWRLLPSGELSVQAIRQHYKGLQQQNPHIKYETERITKALSLRPDRYYVGEDEFEGYIVLTFAHTPKALMECPVFGNAIYIINSDWKSLSKMTKQELLARGSMKVTRIVHKGDWFSRVKTELGIRQRPLSG